MTEDVILTRINRNTEKFIDYTIHHTQKLAGCEALPLIMKGQYELFEEGLCELQNMVYDHHSAVYIKDKDRVIGVLTYFFNEGFSPKILNVVLGYVENDYRCNGILNFLGIEVKKVAMLNKCEFIEFITSVNNRRMQRLAVKMGCVQVTVKYRFEFQQNKRGG